ncbi:MAG: tetratricopeptide repeat protein [Actinomycetes bacterium]
MAMNKSRTSMPMKILIIVLAVAMASSIPLGTLFSSLSSQPRVSDTQTGTTTGSSDQIAQQYAATIKANDAALAKSPKEYSILVSQGNTYFDWAQQVQQAPALAAQQQQLPLWTKAAGYYGRAIAATKTFDPQVGTDLSVSYYYGGQADKAITMIERVLKVAPTLTPALLNAGIFYESTNQTATAVAMYTKLIGVKGASADQVKFVEGRLAGLKK